MDANQGGVNDMQDSTNTLVTLQIQLARIEEGIKPLAALVPAVAEVKDVSKEALQCAQQTATKLSEVEATLKRTEDTAHEAKRRAEDANRRLDKQEESQKWLKRTFYGAIIAGGGSAIFAIVWAGIKIGGAA